MEIPRRAWGGAGSTISPLKDRSRLPDRRPRRLGLAAAAAATYTGVTHKPTRLFLSHSARHQDGRVILLRVALRQRGGHARRRRRNRTMFSVYRTNEAQGPLRAAWEQAGSALRK